MTNRAARGPIGPHQTVGDRVAGLLARYPRISAAETQEIVTFFRTGRYLDLGRLTSDELLRSKLDAFMADHKARFRMDWVGGAAAIAAILALTIVLFMGA